MPSGPSADRVSVSEAMPSQPPQPGQRSPEECGYVMRIKIFASSTPSYTEGCNYANITRNQRYNLVHRSFASSLCTEIRPLARPIDVYIPWRVNHERVRATHTANLVFYGSHAESRPVFRITALVTNDRSAGLDLLLGRPFFNEFVYGFNPVPSPEVTHLGIHYTDNLYLVDSEGDRRIILHYRFGGGSYRRLVSNRAWATIEAEILTGHSGQSDDSDGEL